MSSKALRAVAPSAARRPAEAADLLGGVKALDVVFPNGGILPIEYDPTSFTGEVIPDEEDPRQLAKVVCEVVTSWELVVKGVPVPVGPDHVEEVFKRCPVLILAHVQAAILKDITPDPPNARS